MTDKLIELIDALSKYEAQDKMELDFCYEGGSQDAVLCAKAFYPYAKSIQSQPMVDVAEYLAGQLEEHDGVEINPCNYGHDDVVNLNNGYVGLFQSIEEAIRQLTQPPTEAKNE